MCDTLAAVSNKTKNNSIILAKNSDREVNEAQVLSWVPALLHDDNSKVQCTFIEIPQVKNTNGVFLSRPFWMFGAEMGLNDKGVAIGNEAVFTKAPYSKSGLTGMDILRLALERSDSATSAIETVAWLLSDYGQGGNCAMEGSLYYHNSFIIADNKEAFIMETVDRHWAVKKIQSTGALSNILTIEDDFEFSSPGIRDYALSFSSLKKDEKLNFRKTFKDTIYSHFASGDTRRMCSKTNLTLTEKISCKDMAVFLRDHNEEEPFDPSKNYMKRVCMHGGGLISSQSTGSMIVELKDGHKPLAWFTGTSAPCMSIFKPWIFPSEDSFKGISISNKNSFQGIDIYGTPTDKRDLESLWWLGENIHRKALPRYRETIDLIQEKRNPFEENIFETVENLWSKKKLKIEDCITINEEAVELTRNINNSVKNHIKENKIKKRGSLIFRSKWHSYNKKAQWKE